MLLLNLMYRFDFKVLKGYLGSLVLRDKHGTGNQPSKCGYFRINYSGVFLMTPASRRLSPHGDTVLQRASRDMLRDAALLWGCHR